MAQQIVSSFDDIAAGCQARTARIVWCTMATTDAKGRTRVRLVHPVFEGSTGWITTRRDSNKSRHIAANPHVSLSYWDPQHQQVYAECHAQWIDDVAEKRRVWELFKATPSPYGYDPAMFWPGGPASDDFGVLRCTPWRVELTSMTPSGFESRVWRPQGPVT